MKLEKKTGSSRPYFIEAMYQWLSDYDHTIYLSVDAHQEGVIVPRAYVNEDGTILLNVSPRAVQHWSIGRRLIRFQAQFSGQTEYLEVPVHAVLSIGSKEEPWRSMAFDYEDPDLEHDEEDGGATGGSGSPKGAGQSSFLKIVK